MKTCLDATKISYDPYENAQRRLSPLRLAYQTDSDLVKSCMIRLLRFSAGLRIAAGMAEADK